MVLNLDKERIARCFRRSIATYDEAAEVQNRLVNRLVAMLDQVPDEGFTDVFEIGCCTGTLTEKLCAVKPVQKIFCNDLVPEFEEVLLARFPSADRPRIIPCFGDVETMDLPQGLSLVLSGATFQWLDDLPAFIERLGRSLASGSWLEFSLFTPGTLAEFSAITGIKLDYVGDEELQQMLVRDFAPAAHDSYFDTLTFPSVRAILAHIRATGVGGVSEYSWNRKSLENFEKEYARQFSTADGMVVSYSSSCYLLQRR